MTDSFLRFPQGFRWGTASSSYQVEGSSTNNDWWAAAQAGGIIYRDQSAGLACDWWNRAEEDFDRMVQLNQNAHRLSIEWSRVEPEPGVWDDSTLARYREMVQGLRDRGIEPMVTLHHFTNPLWLAERGGWENEAVAGWFEQYTRKVVAALGDLVTLWCPINEPAVMIAQAYGLGRWLPGKKDFDAALHAAVNLMRAHAAAYHAIHELRPDAQVGIASHMIDWRPWRPWLPTDHLATHIIDHLFNHLTLLMITTGRMAVPGRRLLRLREIAGTLDWLGVNYYQRYRVRVGLLAADRPSVEPRTRANTLRGPGLWGEIHPQGLSDILGDLWRRYGLPMIITENGIPDAEDRHRPHFILSHLHQVYRAVQRNIPILGYYFWSIVDNFEWTEGYDPRFRFGLIQVDFETQERHIRPSGWLYGTICKEGGISPEVVDQYAPQLAHQLFRA
jgi:beta-glucosidase